jgi:hypothetical protein
MNKKIIAILSCLFLITAIVLPVSGSFNEKTKTNTDGLDLIPVLDFKEIKGGFLELSVVLENSGTGDASYVYYEIRPSGGLFFYTKIKSGEIPLIHPGESVKLIFKPALGLGIINIEFYCRYLIGGMYCETEIEVKQEWRNRALLILNTFPEEIQPQKEWMDIEEYYYYESDDAEVMLTYQHILNMHNVRVVSSADSFNETVEFRAACKFDGGIGHLKECWITRELVESGIGHWEVELVDGE